MDLSSLFLRLHLDIKFSWYFEMNKYGSKKTGGFASKLESAVYDLLVLRENAGEISDIKIQQSVYLTDARILYKPDFSFMIGGKMVWAEAKGFKTAVWAIKKRLWEYYGPGVLEIYEGNYRNPRLTERLVPK